MSDLDAIRQSIYDWIKDQSAQLDHIREEAATHRSAVNKAVNMLSNELFGFGKQIQTLIEHAETEHAHRQAWQDTNESDRLKRQQWQDYKDIAIGCLIVLTLVIGCSIIGLLAYVVLTQRIIAV